MPTKMEQSKFHEKLKELLSIAKKKKSVLEEQEIKDFFSDMELTENQINHIYETLDNNGIDIFKENFSDDVDLLEPDDDAMIDADTEGLDLDNILDLSVPDGVSIEDPVRMYLKEIGKVSLLSADEEVNLAVVIDKGSECKTQIHDLEKKLRKPDSPEAKEELTKKLEKLREEYKTAIDEGEAAKKRLAEANLRLVVSIAKRYVGRGMQFLDLIQEGNLGLIKAVEKFDHNKGYKFSTYAQEFLWYVPDRQ